MASYTVVIEQGEDGFLIASVPAIPGCHTQGKTLDELMAHIKEAIELCIGEGVAAPECKLLGAQSIDIDFSGRLSPSQG